MTEIIPKVFKNFQASLLAARAYSIEEMNNWTVVYSNNNYKPCRSNDLKDTLKNGYNLCTSIRFEKGEYKEGR